VGDDQSADELVRAFARWAAQERAGFAAEERARRRWLGEQAVAGSTLVGILVDLAEQAAQVGMSLPDHTCAGRIVGVGTDFCVVNQTHGRPAVVALHHVGAVWPEPGARLAAGDRPPALEMSLAATFAAMAEERLPVAVRVGQTTLEGEVYGIGEDVVTLRSNPPNRRWTHIPLRAVLLCELR
jgi:hypothetical protein